MNQLSDGTASWIGGMDTSRSPVDISDLQYSRACNVFIPRSLGGVRHRDGIHYQFITYRSSKDKLLYEKGHISAEGWFTDKGKYYLLVVVDGYVFKLTPVNKSTFAAEVLNANSPNQVTDKHWVCRVPNGAIVNNGVNLPLYVTANSIRRTDPSNNEIGPGKMGVYVQNRFFYSNDKGNIIYASDYGNPVGIKEHGLTGIYGFSPPENQDTITAVGKQKVMLEYAEGGALMFSTRNNIYSVDVRGDRNTWASQGSRVGKVTQTVEGLNASSSYSFEAFGTNVYFRNSQFGIADLKQSQYQFAQMDGIVSESIEASYWLEHDTEWMLDKCYTRSWNSRLFTTVAPQQDDEQRVYWGGLISFHPAAIYANQEAAPRRYESLITGVRPWCVSSVKSPNEGDQLFIHSFDIDGINRLYRMVRNSSFDINSEGKRVEIEGWIETKGYDFKERFSLKKEGTKFYSLRPFNRDITIKMAARKEDTGRWIDYFTTTHKVGDSYTREANGSITPVTSRPQTRSQVNLPGVNFNRCKERDSFLWIQDRIEFTGPLHLDSFIRAGSAHTLETSVYQEEKTSISVSYEIKDDFSYYILNGQPIK